MTVEQITAKLGPKWKHAPVAAKDIEGWHVIHFWRHNRQYYVLSDRAWSPKFYFNDGRDTKLASL